MKKTIIAVLTILAVGTFAQKRTVGLQLYSLKDSMRVNVPATLKAVAGMGYQVVETAGYDNGKLYGYTPREFNNLVREQGMEVASAHVSHPNEPEAMKWWDLALDTQKAAGCTYVFMPSMPDFKTIEEVREFCNYFNEVGKLARSKGLRFGYHNHSAEFGKIGDEVIFDKMVEFTDPRYVTFQLDVHNAMNGGADPVALIRKHGKRIAVLHVKDDGIVGESGKLDFREIVVAAKKAGIKDYYIEVESYRLPPFECVQTSVENLKNCF